MIRSAIRFFGVTALFVGLCVTSACSQIKPPGHGASTVYVGSTPCDSLIFNLLRIPSGEICEFIKWTLDLKKTGTSLFHLTAIYGESQPNTNGFKGGGKTIDLSGQFTIETGQAANPKAKIYKLTCSPLRSPLWLVEMDDNILHLADSSKNLLVGNGGWGYVLNRLH